MSGQMYELDFENGGMKQIDQSKNLNVENGRVVMWGGNMAWSPEKFVVVEKIVNDFGTAYQMVSLKDYDFHRTESHSMKTKNDKVRHSQYMFIQDEILSEEQTQEIYRRANLRKEFQQQKQEEARHEKERLIQKGKDVYSKLSTQGVKAFIVANKIQNESDIQTDYFAHSRQDKVVLALSKHTRKLFPEMRKAASNFKETQHLATKLYRVRVVFKDKVQCNGNYYNEGSYSHWHSDVEKNEDGRLRIFKSKEKAESYIMDVPLEGIYFDDKLVHFKWEVEEIETEHRENYSMGHGTYLKWGHSDSTGWEVCKEKIYNEVSEDIYLALGKHGLVSEVAK